MKKIILAIVVVVLLAFISAYYSEVFANAANSTRDKELKFLCGILTGAIWLLYSSICILVGSYLKVPFSKFVTKLMR